jgi:hypothetical protein
MTSNARLSHPATAFTGYVRYADGSIVSLQCYDGFCRECPDQALDSESGTGALDGYNCEHGCGHGPAVSAGPAAL